MARMTTYNPRKVTCALSNHIVTGFADDSFITVEPASDGTTHVIGADGEIARSIDPSTIYTVKISLLQYSETNDYLQRMFDKDSQEGDGIFSVTVTDLLGNQKFTSALAWVAKPASWERAKEQSVREWEITVAEGRFT